MGMIPFSDLVRYVREHIGISGPQSMPSFAAEAQAWSEGMTKVQTLEEGFRQMDSKGLLNYRPYDSPRIETASPDSVFDIFNVDSDNFWNHHGNTKEDYMELASHLPEIQERMANGESLDSIRSNPHLSNTVDAYYADDKMMKVVKYEDGYQFQDDGRHRMMAAKELGYDVPVKVVGEYTEEETEEEETEVTEDNTKALREAEEEAEEEAAKARKELEEEEEKAEKEFEEETVRTEKELEKEADEVEKEIEADEGIDY